MIIIHVYTYIYDVYMMYSFCLDVCMYVCIYVCMMKIEVLTCNIYSTVLPSGFGSNMPTLVRIDLSNNKLQGMYHSSVYRQVLIDL